MREFSKDPTAIARLSPEQYRVGQQSGTESPGSGEYLDNTILHPRDIREVTLPLRGKE